MVHPMSLENDNTTARLKHNCLLVFRWILIVLLAVGIMDCLGKLWGAFSRPRPALLTSNALSNDIVPIAWERFLVGYWTVDAAQFQVEVVQDLEGLTLPDLQPLEFPPTMADQASVRRFLTAVESWPDHDLIDEHFERFRASFPSVWCDTILTRETPRRIAGGRLVWQNGSNSRLVLTITPPQFPEATPTSLLAPVRGPKPIARRWSSDGQLVGEIYLGPENLAEWRQAWRKEGGVVELLREMNLLRVERIVDRRKNELIMVNRLTPETPVVILVRVPSPV